MLFATVIPGPKALLPLIIIPSSAAVVSILNNLLGDVEPIPIALVKLPLVIEPKAAVLVAYNAPVKNLFIVVDAPDEISSPNIVPFKICDDLMSPVFNCAAGPYRT